MNYPQYCVQDASAPRIIDPHTSFISSDHELICLSMEEALNFGFDAQYGIEIEEPKTYYLYVFDCPLLAFCDILKAAAIRQSVTALNIYGKPVDEAASGEAG